MDEFIGQLTYALRTYPLLIEFIADTNNTTLLRTYYDLVSNNVYTIEDLIQLIYEDFMADSGDQVITPFEDLV